MLCDVYIATNINIYIYGNEYICVFNGKDKITYTTNRQNDKKSNMIHIQ